MEVLPKRSAMLCSPPAKALAGSWSRSCCEASAMSLALLRLQAARTSQPQELDAAFGKSSRTGSWDSQSWECFLPGGRERERERERERASERASERAGERETKGERARERAREREISSSQHSRQFPARVAEATPLSLSLFTTKAHAREISEPCPPSLCSKTRHVWQPSFSGSNPCARQRKV